MTARSGKAVHAVFTGPPIVHNAAMIRSNLIGVIAAVTLLAVPATALAQDEAVSEARGIGIGAQAMLTGPIGASVTYDAGQFHIDGIFAIYDDDPGDTEVQFGARFYYTVHERGVSDLSVGGGLGLINQEENDIHIEGSAKIRVWLVSNVAFSTTLGLGFVLDGDQNNSDDLALTGQLNALFGVTYFFN